MHHPAYATEAGLINESLASLSTDALRSEERTPLAASLLLPTGLLGLFAAAMLGAFISTNDTYLHSWGAIFVQDVVLPFRKKPLSTRTHLALLKGSIMAVAVFAVLFSQYYEPTQYISMFLALTGAVFIGGAGSAIIGGLYWKRGTTQAAWTAMILGLVVSTAGILIKQTFVGEHLFRTSQNHRWWSEFAYEAWLINQNEAITGQVLTFLTILISVSSYILVSLLGPRSEYDLDRLLHRGKYQVAEDLTEQQTKHAPWLEKLGFNPEFTGSDKWVTLITISWPLVWTVIFIIGTLYSLSTEVTAASWLEWWHGWLRFTYAAGIVVMIWFTIGGFRDLRALFRRLACYRQADEDDGHVDPQEGE